MFKTTWGELRSLNADKLVRKMASIGKGVRVSFKIHTDNYSEWVIIPAHEYEDMKLVSKEKDKLETLTQNTLVSSRK